MTREPAIALEGVSLRYRLAKQRIPTFKEMAIHWLRGNLTYESLWALSDVNLDIDRGEMVGVIGRNGAGKSTLLKVISGVLKPTKGTVVVRGTVAPILELAAGFDHELTGSENILLNALLLGHTRREIEGKVEEIVEFSELGDFIRTPVRNYSSGMLARLGFAIATAWIPDILIIDEVLAVGDEAFTRKCERRMRRFVDAGATVLLVSHSGTAIRDNCSRAVWLEKGRIQENGDPDRVCDNYGGRSGSSGEEEQEPSSRRRPTAVS